MRQNYIVTNSLRAVSEQVGQQREKIKGEEKNERREYETKEKKEWVHGDKSTGTMLYTRCENAPGKWKRG